MQKPDLHIVSFSGGKDSTAMLLHMMELGMKIDVVLYCDTWMEFPAMYRHVEKVKKIVEDACTSFKKKEGETWQQKKTLKPKSRNSLKPKVHGS